MVRERKGFQKTSDLAERVLPAHIDVSTPGMEEFAAQLLDQQLRCHGFASLKGLTYLRRQSDLRITMKTLVQERLAQGLLESLQIGQGEVFFSPTGLLDQPLPRLNNRLSILSPFDNSVIQRGRVKILFDFDYQIECYVPAAKRQFGYFSLPLLYRDQFVGRMDCKAHRKSNHLEIKALHLDGRRFDEAAFAAAFMVAIKRFCRFQGCDSVAIKAVYPKRMTQQLRDALKGFA